MVVDVVLETGESQKSYVKDMVMQFCNPLQT